jgi:hypothetical protein
MSLNNRGILGCGVFYDFRAEAPRAVIKLLSQVSRDLELRIAMLAKASSNLSVSQPVSVTCETDAIR